MDEFLQSNDAMLKEILGYIITRDRYDKAFLSSITKMYRKNSLWANFVVRWIEAFLQYFIGPKKRQIKYFFFGTKYQEIILSLPQNQICVIGGPKQLLFCLRHRLPFLSYSKIWGEVYHALMVSESSSKLGITSEISRLAQKLHASSRSDAILIIENDSLPAQRSAICAAKLAGMKGSVCIQHGIYQSKSPHYIFDGFFCDKLLLINDHQRHLFESKGVSRHKLRVMGFHSSPYTPKRKISLPVARKVCILGQPWVKYGGEKGTRYREIVSEIIRALRLKNIPVVYKPHPWEDKKGYQFVECRIIKGPLTKSFEKYDVFLSLTSTALLEADAAGRISIQIKDSVFDADDLSVHGNIAVIEATNICEDLFHNIYRCVGVKAVDLAPGIRFVKALCDG